MIEAEQVNALVGAALRDKREAVGMSQSVLAAELGLSRTSVTNIESGRQPISMHHLYQAAAALGSSVRDFLPDIMSSTPKEGRRAAEVIELLNRLNLTQTSVKS